MGYSRSKVGKLEKISLRLNFALLISLLLVVFFVTTGYWVTYKVMRGELVKVNYHFLRLIACINEHETFLLRSVKASTIQAPVDTTQALSYVFKNTHLGQVGVYEGRERKGTTSFSVVLPDAAANTSHTMLAQMLDIGVNVTDLYNGFWSESSFTSPQMFLFDLANDLDLAVPSLSLQYAEGGQEYRNLLRATSKIKQVIRKDPPSLSDLVVRWAPSDSFIPGGDGEVLAYVSGRMSVGVQGQQDHFRELVAASLLELSESKTLGVKIDNQFLGLRPFESIDLLSPEGVLLIGKDSEEMLRYESGLYFSSSGLVIKRSTGTLSSWQALYRISYGRLLEDAIWPLLSLMALLVACVMTGWSTVNWYRRRVVAPAGSDYRELLENHDFNHSILQTVPLALCVLKGSDLQRVTENSLFTQWLGKAEDVRELMRDWNMFEDEQPLHGEGCLIVDGHYLYVRFAPTEYQGESVLLCTFNDITSHRAAASSLVLARDAADSANEAKSNFIATVSHEIRTPLYGVLGTLELLGLTELNEQQKGYLRTIDNSSGVLLQLISDVLDVSRIEAGQMALEPVSFDPVKMLEEVIRGFSATASNKGLMLYGFADIEVPQEVTGDSLRIQQVISNLLNNAIKFTDSGEVSIRLLVVTGNRDKVVLQWQVRDTGPGISEAMQGHLFERFYQVDSKQHTVGGTGLGLSICASLSQLMGGSLTVHSELGKGSCFTFSVGLDKPRQRQRLEHADVLGDTRLFIRTPFPELTTSLRTWFAFFGLNLWEPQVLENGKNKVLLDVMTQALPFIEWPHARIIAGAEFSVVPKVIGKDILVNQHSLTGMLQALNLALGGDPPQSSPEATGAMRPSLSLRVLLAEDNPVNQQLMKEQLEHIGCSVDTASNGQEALRLLNGMSYDLLLTDVNMPVMDGYAFAQTVRQQNSDIAIVGVTANAFREEGEHCIRAGMNSWLTKPVDIEGLYLCLNSVINRTASDDVLPEQCLADTATVVTRLMVPERMLELFLVTVSEDLTALKAAISESDVERSVLLLHRIRGALAVAKAKGLILECRALENAIVREGLTGHMTPLAIWIEKIERAALLARETS